MLKIIVVILMMGLTACSDYWTDTVDSSGLDSFEQNPIDTSKIDSTKLILPKLSTPPAGASGESTGMIAPIHEAVPNLIYISRSASETTSPGVVAAGDVVIWNGLDNFITATGGSTETDPSANLLYIGKVVDGSSNVELVGYVPFDRIASDLGNKYSTDTTIRTYPAKLLGAVGNADGSITLAYQKGSIVYLDSLTSAEINSANATSPVILNAPFKTILDFSSSKGADVGKEYESLGLYGNRLLSNCPGGADFATDGTANMFISFGRGLQLPEDPNPALPANEKRKMGQPFSRYSMFTGLNLDNADIPNDNLGIKFSENKNLNTHRPCYEAVSFNPFTNSFGVLTYSLTDRFRFATIDIAKNTQTKNIFLNDKKYTSISAKKLIGLSPLPVNKSSLAGNTKNAFSLILNYTDKKILAQYGRKNPAPAFFVVNSNILTPSSDAPESVKFIFNKDITTDIRYPKSITLDNAAFGPTIVIVLSNYLMELDMFGLILKGPTPISNELDGMAIGDKMFYFKNSQNPAGAVGWVVYDTKKLTNEITLYKYNPHNVI